METVIWKHYVDKYYVSNSGLIKNNNTGRILRPRLDKRGYVKHSLSVNGEIITVYPHRLVGLLFVEGFEEGLTIDHIDGNKLNNHLSNLEWVSNTENISRAHKMGLHDTRGERNGNAKLTEKDVIWIREHYIKKDKDYGTKAIAQKYNIGETTVREIISGKKWKNI